MIISKNVRLIDYFSVTHATFDLIVFTLHIDNLIFSTEPNQTEATKLERAQQPHCNACSIDQLLNACALHFTQGKPCIGCPLPREHRQGGDDGFVISQSPIPRMIAKKCHRVLGDGEGRNWTNKYISNHGSRFK